ncbi:unnamed protein product [Ceutorhynchus assimilis]|uniref:PEHE domain-containing protein n=1 Tax=Ceutorhynchus assimilis TaxID=467358 RepID=A0A9P0GKD4_9CUCU|nr:unnamed protein product [Ceutorhynchus assimilis]
MITSGKVFAYLFVNQSALEIKSIFQLKERLLCLEKGIPYEPTQHLKIELNPEGEDNSEDSLSEDMTQDSCGEYVDKSKENLDQDTQQSDNVVTCSLEVNNFQVHHATDDVESQVDTTIEEDDFIEVEVDQFEDGEDYLVNNLSETESDTKDSFPEYKFTVNNFCEFESMKNIKMSIKRKRVSSLSSLTNNEPSLLEEKKTLRRAKKKRKRSSKDPEILIAKEPYYVYNPNEEAYADPEPVTEIPETASLEVPRWRLKHYTSCYTMEGTENLDDEVFNKRHIRLEIDERRRKRWDVQRIREQRVIDKLKQRQDRIGNGSKGETDQDSLGSLLPKVEDVKFLEVVEELPVSSFGHPLPKSEHKHFSLPWLDNPSANTRRTNSKRSSSSRRRKRLRHTR